MLLVKGDLLKKVVEAFDYANAKKLQSEQGHWFCDDVKDKFLEQEVQDHLDYTLENFQEALIDYAVAEIKTLDDAFTLFSDNNIYTFKIPENWANSGTFHFIGAARSLAIDWMKKYTELLLKFVSETKDIIKECKEELKEENRRKYNNGEFDE